MSDIGKQFRKQKTRVKEKLLEGLGKAKATQDDVFDQHASNLVKQSKACEKLNRDLKAYGSALKAVVNAQKTLRETIRELYEPEWPDREHLCAMTQSLDLQWDEYEKTVNDQLMGSVNAYMAQLPILKEKVAKRRRKLVDYDGARNNLNAVKASSKKGDEDPKVVKAVADFDKAKALYKEINKELLDALPAAYDSRITFFVDTLQTLFNAEGTNHLECAKYNKTLVTQLDNLGNSFESLRVPRPESGSSSQHEESSNPPSLTAVPTPLPRKSPPPVASKIVKEEAPNEEKIENTIYPALTAEATDVKELKEAVITERLKENESKSSLNPFEEEEEETEKKDSTNPFDDSDEEKGQNGHAAKTEKADEGSKNGELEVIEDRKVLHKVRATHRYDAEDTDELTFEAGEVLSVLESREEDQLDEGWLLGIKQSNGARGVFPANFTKPL